MRHEDVSTHQFTVPLRADTIATFRRLLVPVDFNEPTRCALGEALQLHLHFGSEVHLFRYVEPCEADCFLAGSGAEGLALRARVDESEDRVRRLVETQFPGHEAEVSVYASAGMGVADAILEEARRVDATLVLIGVEPKPHLWRTEVERLLQRLACPVWLVRSRHDATTH